MAVMRNSIIFGGVNSADYGIYISGEGVFNAPERDVEVVDVPGRNGAIVIDKGRYKNIDVKYPAFNYESTLADFKSRLCAFRNAVCSQRGYQRLTDTFHPDEYRMAVYKDGLEFEPIKYNTASEFDLIFDCKPQRFLTSGDTVQSFGASGSITNPTSEIALPLLNVKGTGAVQIGDRTLTIRNRLVGDFFIESGQSFYSEGERTISIEKGSALMNAGDTITVKGFNGSFALTSKLRTSDGTRYQSITALTFTGITGGITPTYELNGRFAQVYLSVPQDLEFINEYSTDNQLKNYSAYARVTFEDGSTALTQIGMGLYLNPTTASAPETFHILSDALGHSSVSAAVSRIYVGEIRGNSTAYALGDDNYIDCESGDCYRIEDGVVFSINDAVVLDGGQLPRLLSGENQISLGTGITEVEITPRWWQI